jgi:hypothetical protein
VLITGRGEPTHVLLSIEDYQRLLGHQRKITDSLAMPEPGNVEFSPPRVTINTRDAGLG